jgi:hypothetical protein
MVVENIFDDPAK